MADERVTLTTEEALRRIPTSPKIGAIRMPLPNILVRALWSRKQIVRAIQKFPVEESGPNAAADGYGICLNDEKGCLFIETRKDMNRGY